MKKWTVYSTPNTETTETVVLAETEEEAIDNWSDDKNIISKRTIKHDNGYLEAQPFE
jgi:hypothetical protein